MVTEPSLSPMEHNQLLANHYRDPSWRQKAASKMSGYIQDIQRESEFYGNIVPMTPLKRGDMQVHETRDTLVKLVWMQPETAAVTIEFDNTVQSRYITAKRFPVSLFKISSKRYEYSKEDMEIYPFPIVSTVATQMQKDMSELVDYYGLAQFEMAVLAQQRAANALAFTANFTSSTAMTGYNLNAGTTVSRGVLKGDDAINSTSAASAAAGCQDTEMWPLAKNDLVKLGKIFSGRGGRGSRMELHGILMSSYDAQDMNMWTASEVGYNEVANTAIRGWKHNTLIGHKVVVTKKTDMLRPGNIYGFTVPEAIGGYHNWGNVETFMDQEQNMCSMQAWRRLCIYIANISSIRKLETFAGTTSTVTGVDTTAVAALYSPVSESRLKEEPNHYVGEGQYFPQVSAY